MTCTGSLFTFAYYQYVIFNEHAKKITSTHLVVNQIWKLFTKKAWFCILLW